MSAIQVCECGYSRPYKPGYANRHCPYCGTGMDVEDGEPKTWAEVDHEPERDVEGEDYE